ncbi:MAG: tetratricopeptide repeat protein [Sphingobacteriales bacterium]|nr:MAG: tetratricopeptide repeat protein [Sphingobacteriales bacterium]
MDTPKYTELKQLYNSLHNENARIDTYVDMAMEVRNIDVERAMDMAEEIIARSDKQGYRLGKGRGMNLKGWCYWQLGEYDDGIEILQNALGVAREIKSRPLEARTLNNLGYIYRDRGDLADALNNFEKALAINEALGDEVAQSVNLASIAYVHYDLNDYEHALDFALRCLPIFERAKDMHRLTSLYTILGNIYFKQEQYSEALKYFEENLVHTEPDTALNVMAISGLGKVYYKMHDFNNARKYLREALDKSETLGNAEVQIISNFYMGRLMMDESIFRQALQHMNAAFDLAREYTRKHDIMSVHEGLSLLYDKMGDIPKAFHHLKAYEKLKEEIFKQTTLNKLRNLQSRQQLELAQKEKEVAERTANLKQQFMANMSHEIRTPMNAIVGMTRLLLGKEPRPEQIRYLDAIRLSADNLLVIVNDILDLSKIEAGKIVIEQTDFDLEESVQSVRDMLMLKAEEKHIAFRTSIDERIPNFLIGDPTRVNQVLINLAGNAIKFTEKGHVEVNAVLDSAEGDKVWVRFDVVDTGIGIDAGYVDKIFDSFTQAGTDITRKFGGTGLGLTISKQLVTLMQGDIDVKSQLGKGTTFSVTVPFTRSGNTEKKKRVSTINPAAINKLNNVKLLLVEDNEFNRMVAEDTLKEIIPGVSIDIAVNGEEAVKRVQTQQYDVVLMDIQMPVMDGLTATQTIRALPAPAGEVKIIAMTANVFQEDVQRYMDAGMDAYVSKPFNTEELLQKMANTIQGVASRTTIKTEEVEVKKEPQLAPLPDKVTDMHFLHQFTSGNSEKMNKYVNMFLENGPRLLTNIEQALLNKDYPSVKIAAHSLKPQLSYMGVKEEVSKIFIIEQTAGEAAHQHRLPEFVANLKRVCEKAFEELKVPIA